MKRPSAWARAFELAESGRLADRRAVQRRLAAEGYNPSAVSGRKLCYELDRLCGLAQRANGSARG